MILAFNALGEKDPSELILTKVATSEVTVGQLADASALERFKLLNDGPAVTGENGAGGKLHMVRPLSDPAIPWSALLVGLWIPNFFYWGLNQYIMQRTLGSKSLAEGQKGIVFAALLKLIIPFIVVIPGILAFNLYSDQLKTHADQKNAATLAVFESGSDTRAYPFTENYAKLYPELSFRLLAHNLALAGETPGETSPAGIDAAALHAANNNALATIASSTPRAQRLTGYDYDAAFGTLLRNLLQPGFTWFVLAAIFGAVVSSLASMLNSASTIFTMDIFNKLVKGSSQSRLVAVGRTSTVVFVLIACLIAPGLGRPEFGGIFSFIQEFQGFISPGILAVFLFGFLVHRAPRYLGWLGIAINAALYGSLKIIAPQIAFLDRMAICFGVVVAIMGLLTLVNPLAKPVVMPVNNQVALDSSPVAKVAGCCVVVLTLALYVVFW
jgi:SSS family solute:Na+ symporter